jgi:hypothetical protein
MKKESVLYVIECRQARARDSWMPLDDYYCTTLKEAKERVREDRAREPRMWTYHIVLYRRAYVTR